MAVYQIVRATRDGDEVVSDSGFGRSEFARIGRERQVLAHLTGRIERIRVEGLEHELRLKTRNRPDTVTITEDCRCDIECRNFEPIVRFEVRPL